jgi:hypothetical protein
VNGGRLSHSLPQVSERPLRDAHLDPNESIATGRFRGKEMHRADFYRPRFMAGSRRFFGYELVVGGILRRALRFLLH